MNIIDELEWRGAINQTTDKEALKELTENKNIGLYCGTDPTGDSLHIGHLIPFMILKRFQLAGHHPVIIIGGGTGAIGDPSGRKTERTLQTESQLEHNKKALTEQMKKLFSTENFTIVDNYNWLKDFTMIDFLRDFGKLFNVNTMLNKEVVASRLDSGISFTEFTYQILQAVDFLHLYQNNSVQLEIGGSDQWGNITAGIDLIHKVEGPDAKVYGLTIPLMLKADGTKFGKTAGGAIWLDPKKTSPFTFYQFWLNQDDRDVVKYLKYFTFLSHEEIDELATKVKSEPQKREAQHRLAEEVTKFVHGEEAMKQAKKISKILFSGKVAELSTGELQQAFEKVPSVEISATPTNIINWLVENKIESSKRQAREDVKNGAITINGQKVIDESFVVDPSINFDGKYVVARKGKRNYFLAKVK